MFSAVILQSRLQRLISVPVLSSISVTTLLDFHSDLHHNVVISGISLLLDVVSQFKDCQSPLQSPVNQTGDQR